MAVKKARGSRWQPIMIVKVYRLVRLGVPDTDVCKTLGVSRMTYYTWLKEKPELAEAVQIAKKELSEGQGMPGWVYDRLPPELQQLWERVQVWAGMEEGAALIERAMQDNGTRVRQQLFLHALCAFGFNFSQALRAVNLTKKQLDAWLRDDVEFRLLVDEVGWHKGNFFEAALARLVQEGNPAAVIFANKTYNRTRGYAQKVEVEHSGSVMHGVLDLNELFDRLDPDSRGKVLHALRALEEEKRRLPAPTEDIILARAAELAQEV